MRANRPILSLALAAAATFATSSNAFAAPPHSPVVQLGTVVQPGAVTQQGPQSRGIVLPSASAQHATFPYPGPMHEVRGFIRALNGNSMVLQTRHGMLNVDLTWTLQHGTSTALVPNAPVRMRAALVSGKLIAFAIDKDHSPPRFWPADR